jgi:hypothetical protein
MTLKTGFNYVYIIECLHLSMYIFHISFPYSLEITLCHLFHYADDNIPNLYHRVWFFFFSSINLFFCSDDNLNIKYNSIISQYVADTSGLHEEKFQLSIYHISIGTFSSSSSSYFLIFSDKDIDFLWDIK